MSATAPLPPSSDAPDQVPTAAEQLDRSTSDAAEPPTTEQPTDFELRRLLPKGWLFRGRGLATLLLATLSTLALIAALAGLELLTGLLVDRGAVSLTPDQAATIAAELGDDTPDELNPDATRRQTVINQGILPQMVNPDSIGPLWVRAIYQTIPALRETRSAFAILLVLTLFAGIVYKLGELAARAQADRLAHDVGVRLRASLHRQALRLNSGDLDQRGRRDAEGLFIDEVDRVSAAIRETVFRIARDPLRLVLLAAVLFLLDPMLCLLSLLPLVIGWALIEWERTSGRGTQRLADSRARRHLRALAEALGKSRLIRGYGLESFESQQFQTHMGALQKELMKGTRTWRWRQRFVWTLAFVMLGLILFLVGTEVLSGGRSFTAADGAMFLLTLGLIAATLTSARPLPSGRREIAAIGERINRYLDRIPEVSQTVGAKFIPPMTRNLDYQNVSYTTPTGITLLKDFELRVPAGEAIAIVSIGGSERRDDAPSDAVDSQAVLKPRDGQAALAAALMLPRFIEPRSGRVLFDGEDIAWGTLESLREEVSYVGGREPFFTGTVRENIDCGQNRSMPELVEAAKLVHAHKTILSLPQGYDTFIGEQGERLGPGPAFLLGLARAAVRNPAILIIDEPHVELSDDEKALIDDAYQRLHDGRTIIYLPHRLSTMRRCDRVALIRGGTVAALGHQRDLVSKSDLYRHWEYVTFNPIGKG